MRMPITQTHRGGVVRVTSPPGAWGAVPLMLIEDRSLDLESRAVAIWLATRPNGWQISVQHLLTALDLGRDRWRRIARELEQAGYLSRKSTPTGPGGQWVWEITFCAIPGTRVAEIPAVPQPQKKRRAPPHSVAPPTGVRVAGELKIDPETGIQHDPKNARDAATLKQIRQLPKELVVQAVEQAAALDDQGRAFPSSVLRQIRRGGQRVDDTPAWAQGCGHAIGGEVIEGGIEMDRLNPASRLGGCKGLA